MSPSRRDDVDGCYWEATGRNDADIEVPSILNMDSLATGLRPRRSYDGLPISSGGAHALGRVSARKALTAWRDFLGARTQPSPITCWFALPVTPELTVEPTVVARIEAAFPNRDRNRFPVPLDRVDQALTLFESLEPQPTNPWGMAPVWLWFTADFQLLEPDGPRVWPGQDPSRYGHFQTPAGVTLGASSTKLILQARRSFGLTLSIPDASDDDLHRIVPWLQAALPMRLSAKHWTRWTLTKNGRTYRGKKISPLWSWSSDARTCRYRADRIRHS